MSDTSTNYETIWRTALGELEVLLSKPSFITWFRHTFILDVGNETVTVGVPNTFALEWLTNKYQPQILEVLKKHLPDLPVTKVIFKIAHEGDGPKIRKPEIKIVPEAEALPRENQAGVRQQPDTLGSINPIYTFDTFIVGTHNRLAHAAGLAIASEPGKRHNPFFIYGGVGLGKTHLIHAIGNAIKASDPKKTILYASCERFGSEFIYAIQNKKMDEFKKRYRNADVLLIDDIQFLSGKEGTQEEFFHTFNALHQNNRQLILTSDRMPQAIPELEARLSSRFVWGMVTDIKSPDVETRAAILKQKCLSKGKELPDDVIDLLARTFSSNIRELEGGLNQILAHCELEGIEPTLRVVEGIIKDRGPHRGAILSISQIIGVVSNHYQIGSDDLLGPRRNKEFVHPRQVTMYLLRHELNFSFPKIGRELGKDHTTVMHGILKIEKELPKNSQLQNELAILKEQLYQQTS